MSIGDFGRTARISGFIFFLAEYQALPSQKVRLALYPVFFQAVETL